MEDTKNKMNTQLIQDIILSVLEANDGCTLDNDTEREQVAEKAAQALTLASLEQLAALMGTSLSYDSEGQVLLFTGVYDENKADEIAQVDLKASAAPRLKLHATFPSLDWSSFSSDDVDPTEVP